MELARQFKDSEVMEKILLTRSGYEKLVRELDLLSRVERPQLVQELLEAAQEGGRRTPISSPPWASGSGWTGGFQQLQQTLANAEVMVGSNPPPNRVRFNSLVRVCNLSSGREREFKLVSTLEANAALGHLSTSSPLGRALLGAAPRRAAGGAHPFRPEILPNSGNSPG